MYFGNFHIEWLDKILWFTVIDCIFEIVNYKNILGPNNGWVAWFCDVFRAGPE